MTQPVSQSRRTHRFRAPLSLRLLAAALLWASALAVTGLAEAQELDYFRSSASRQAAGPLRTPAPTLSESLRVARQQPTVAAPSAAVASPTPVQPVSATAAPSCGCEPGASCGSATCETCVPSCGSCGAACGCGDCGCGSIWNRSRLLGDLVYGNPALGAKGIRADLCLTQFYQGVVNGGNQQTFRYGAKMDYLINIDGNKLGLWQGLFFDMHTETRMGEASILDAAALAPANNNMLYPSLDNETAITGLVITQAFSEELAVSFGKFNQLDLLSQIYPQIGRGLTGFMNTSMNFPLSFARTLQLSTMGVGLTKLNEGRVQGSLAVFDTKNVATVSGLDDLFDNGVVVVGFWRVFTNFGGLSGSQGLFGVHSTGTYTSLDPLNWGFLPNLGLIPGQATSSSNLAHFAEQDLWVDPCAPQRKFGLFTAWGITDGDPNPISWSMFAALQGQGLIRNRPADTMGVGYFYTGLTDEVKRFARPVLDLNDVSGVELYYNVAVTPWFHLTPDLQITEPTNQNLDTATTIGFRGKLDF